MVNGGTTTYVPNNLNQYTSVNSVNYSYDLNGNLTQKTDGTDTTSYTYDYENRLKTVTHGTEGAVFIYDALGKRISKEVNGTIQAKYLYDGGNVIAEYDTNNNLTAKYVHGQRIDEVISLTKAGNTYYYHYDGLGSVTDITNSTGSLIEKYTYDIYGSVIIKDANNNVLSQSQIGNRYLFTGRELDQETGLYYYRARYYDPSIGRFLQTDPIGYQGGINLYSYCKNNPVKWVDPNGTEVFFLGRPPFMLRPPWDPNIPQIPWKPVPQIPWKPQPLPPPWWEQMPKDMHIEPPEPDCYTA